MKDVQVVYVTGCAECYLEWNGHIFLFVPKIVVHKLNNSILDKILLETLLCWDRYIIYEHFFFLRKQLSCIISQLCNWVLNLVLPLARFNYQIEQKFLLEANKIVYKCVFRISIMPIFPRPRCFVWVWWWTTRQLLHLFRWCVEIISFNRVTFTYSWIWCKYKLFLVVFYLYCRLSEKPKMTIWCWITRYFKTFLTFDFTTKYAVDD